MNTSFKPSDFDKQAAASLEMMDVEGATERVQAILHPQAAKAPTGLSGIPVGATLTPQPQTQPQAPDDVEWAIDCEVCHKPIVRRGRNRLSNCGHMRMSGGGWVAKDAKPKAPADPDEVTLKVTLSEARDLAMLAAQGPNSLSAAIQDQIIAQLQKRLDALQKQK